MSDYTQLVEQMDEIDALKAQVAELKRENGLMRQYITRLANGSPTGDSPMSIMKALTKDKGEV